MMNVNVRESVHADCAQETATALTHADANASVDTGRI